MSGYDVVVVGARPAGAATAMLLARHGRRVLLLDRGRYGTDTLSTHALLRGGVFLLARWGLLDRIVEAGTPPVRQARFDYGTGPVTVAITPSPGVDALYAPRRTILDPILVDAATAAGVEVRYGVTVTGLLRDGSGRASGVRGRDRDGSALTFPAELTVGADGVRSTVARDAGARTLRTGDAGGAVTYGYWSGLPVVGYEWFYRPGHSAGLIPTNGGDVCVFAGVPADRPRDYRAILTAATGGAAGRLATARPPRRLRTWMGRPSFIRQAYGPGWALVGDAGSFLDPLSTHGITDALRDAELLAGAGDDLARFAAERDQVITPMHEVVDRVAGYAWDIESLQCDLRALSAITNAELELLYRADSTRAASRPAPNLA